MRDQSPNLDFEEPPPVARRSEHLSILLALKDYPGKSIRIKRNEKLDDKAANQLAGVVRRAADKIGSGFDVVTRYVPAVDHYGVWVTYDPTEGDEPPDALEAAHAEAEALKADAQRQGRPDLADAIPATAREITDAEIIGPITMAPGGMGSIDVADDEWESPVGERPVRSS